MYTDKEMGALTLMHYIKDCEMRKACDDFCCDELIERTYECSYVSHQDGTLTYVDTIIIQVIGNCEMAKIFCGTKDEVTLQRDEMFELQNFFQSIYFENRPVELTEDEKKEQYFAGIPFWELPF